MSSGSDTPGGRLVLEVAGRGEGFAGVVGDDHGRRIAFSGWLELAAAIERLSVDPGTVST